MPALPSVNCRFFATQALAQLGQFPEAERLAREALEIAEESGHKYTMILACAAAGAPHLVRGDGHSAIAWQERSLAVAREMAVGIQVPFQSTLLGCAYGLAGRHREAVALLEETLDVEESLRFFATRPRTLTYLGYAYLQLGELGPARDAAERAAEFCARTGRRGDEANALALLGAIHLHGTPPHLENADAALMKSFAIADQLGMRPCIARLYRSRARLETARGDTLAAGRHLAAATDLFREMNLLPRVAGLTSTQG